MRSSICLFRSFRISSSNGNTLFFVVDADTSALILLETNSVVAQDDNPQWEHSASSKLTKANKSSLVSYNFFFFPTSTFSLVLFRFLCGCRRDRQKIDIGRLRAQRHSHTDAGLHQPRTNNRTERKTPFKLHQITIRFSFVFLFLSFRFLYFIVERKKNFYFFISKAIDDDDDNKDDAMNTPDTTPNFVCVCKIAAAMVV